MNSILPISQWLSNDRDESIVVAWTKDHQWTLKQLRNDVCCLIETLSAKEGSRWALCFTESYPFLVALLAALSIGKIPVIPGHSRVSLLNEQQHLFDGIISEACIEDWHGQLIKLDMFNSRVATINTAPLIKNDSYVELFTSGSTGLPKQIIKPIQCLDEEAKILGSKFSNDLSGKRVVASIVPQHMYGLTFRIFLPMALGIPLHSPMLMYAEQLAALPKNYEYIFVSSPAFLKRLDLRLSAPSVQFIFSAGGELPWQVVEHAQQWFGISPTEIYGSTETGVLAYRQCLQENQSWQLFSTINIEEQSEGFRAKSPLISDEKGLLLDDILSFIDEKTFDLLGRRDRAVKIEEKRVSLTEIERRLINIEGIKDCAAIPVARGGRQGIGVVLVLDGALAQRWNEDTKTVEFEWRRVLLQWLEPVAIPRFWRVVTEIPANSMGKRTQGQLAELF